MKVIFGICTRGNDLYYELMNWVIGYLNSNAEIELVLQPSPYSAAHGQELLFRYAWSKKADYLLMIDSDIAPPPMCLEMMVKADKDVVMAPIWFYDSANNDVHLNVSYSGSLLVTDRLYQPKETGLDRIKAASFGLMLVKHKVLQKFKDVNESFTEYSPMLPRSYKKAFSDNIFFKKADILGVESYVLWDVKNVVHNRMVKLSNSIIRNIQDKIKLPVETPSVITKYVDHKRIKWLKEEANESSDEAFVQVAEEKNV